MLEHLFKLKARRAKVVTEILSGIIVFFSMIYILPVNSSIFGDIGMNIQAVFIGTALVSGIVSIFMGLYANYPVALSAGMGMNAFVAYTVSLTLGYRWQEAFALLLLSGVFFFGMSFTPLRKMIINAIPSDIKAILASGLGAFIAFVGLKNSGIIGSNPATLVSLTSLSQPAVLLAFLGILLAFIFYAIPNKRLNQLSILLAMIIVAVTALGLGALNVPGMPTFNANFSDPFDGYSDVFLTVFGSDDQGVNYLWAALTRIETYAVIFSLTMVNVFDTTATLVSIGKGAGLLNEKSEIIGNEAIIVDAVGALICAPLGTSTVTSYAESSIGVESGAKTGLMAVTVGFLFILSIFLYPVFEVFTFAPVTAMALVSVGALMFTNNLKDIHWQDQTIGFTAFTTIVFMILTYSISSGLGIGIIVYLLMMVASGRARQVKGTMYWIGLFYILSFVVSEWILLQ